MAAQLSSSAVSSELIQLEQEEVFSFDPTDADVLDLGIRDLRDEEGLEYPALLLSNVLFVDALKVLQASKRESYRAVDVWLELPEGDGFQKIGSMQADSELMVALRHLKIAATLYYSAEDFEALDLNDPAVLEKFI